MKLWMTVEDVGGLIEGIDWCLNKAFLSKFCVVGKEQWGYWRWNGSCDFIEHRTGFHRIETGLVLA